ncbi:MAG: hypothetical protein J6T10_22830 [Methanobrevibacter sp.]|nr:hypothetical protein [Methanobrevibacter sp.]
MLVEKYKNFDEMYLKLNQKFLTNPDIITSVLSDSGYVENVVIGCKSYDCTLDLSTFGYTMGKWGHLLKTYINYENLLNFYEKLRTVSGTSYTFYFNQKKVNNGSCLISVVLTRKNRNQKWSGMKVFYRVTETQRRMAADLVMLNRFVNELPEDICDIQSVVFFCAQIYCSAKFINGFYDYFGIPREKLDYSHKWINQLKKDYERYFQPDSKIHTFQTLARMQKLYLGLTKYEKIDIMNLSIKNYFESKQKGGKGK